MCISYKKVLPKEKWPRMEHFLKILSHAAKQTPRSEQIDVSNFIRVYQEIYRTEEVKPRWKTAKP